MRWTTGRLVRQDGCASEVAVSRYSTKNCDVHLDLPIGEVVSVEFTDLAVILGEVTAALDERSRIDFIGMASH